MTSKVGAPLRLWEPNALHSLRPSSGAGIPCSLANRRRAAFADLPRELASRARDTRPLENCADLSTPGAPGIRVREGGVANFVQRVDHLAQKSRQLRPIFQWVGAGRDENWDALFALTALFRRVAVKVGNVLGHVYPHELDQRVSAYLQTIRHRPRPSP